MRFVLKHNQDYNNNIRRQVRTLSTSKRGGANCMWVGGGGRRDMERKGGDVIFESPSDRAVPKSGINLDRFLGRVIERVWCEHALSLAVLVLVEDDIAVVLDEAALRECAVEGTESVA